MQTAKLLTCGLISATLLAGTRASYEADKRLWNLSNDWISASFQLSPEGYFLTRQIAGIRSGDVWTASPNQPQSLVSLKTDTDVFDAGTAYNLVRQFTEPVAQGTRQTIVLRDLPGRAEMTLLLEIYTGQPVLRYSLK